jgi:hypothetical protein
MAPKKKMIFFYLNFFCIVFFFKFTTQRKTEFLQFSIPFTAENENSNILRHALAKSFFLNNRDFLTIMDFKSKTNLLAIIFGTYIYKGQMLIFYEVKKN